MSSGLLVSQRKRALLENFQESRKSGVLSKTLEKTTIKEKLETVIRVQGEKGLNALRDHFELKAYGYFKGIGWSIAVVSPH